MPALGGIPAMTEEKRPPSLADLGARLRRARARETALSDSPRVRFSGIGIAFRVGVELVAGIAVGAGIGLLFDRWLGTSPWGLVVFCVLGWGAGVLNVYRLMTRMGQATALPDGTNGGTGREDGD
jgi:ATP synthase protein I